MCASQMESFIVKALLFIPIVTLLFIAHISCSGPSEEDVVAKAGEVVPRTQDLMLKAAFSPEAECRELGSEFAAAYAVEEMPYYDDDPKETMAKLEELDKGLGDFEKDLEQANCLAQS